MEHLCFYAWIKKVLIKQENLTFFNFFFIDFKLTTALLVNYLIMKGKFIQNDKMHNFDWVSAI